MQGNENLLWLVFIVGGFLLGSIMFARIIPMLLYKKDICQLAPDGNPGTANAVTIFGWKAGIICLLLDMLKGFLPVFAAAYMLNTKSPLFSVTMLAPILGHAIAPLCNFRGGKCIATIFGVLLAILEFSPAAALLAFIYIMFYAVIKLKPNRVCSLATFTLFGIAAPILELCLGRYAIASGCLLLSAIALIRHR